MRLRLMAGLLLPVILTLFFTGCSTPGELSGELCRVELERGNGSVFGDNFHILVSREEILWVSRFVKTAERREYTTEYNIPITPEDWQEIEAIIISLEPELKVKRNNPLQRLLPQKEGGTEFHRLKLVFMAGENQKETEYIWTGSPQQRELEALLEELSKANNR